jgi:hypothetical protein
MPEMHKSSGAETIGRLDCFGPLPYASATVPDQPALGAEGPIVVPDRSRRLVSL